MGRDSLAREQMTKGEEAALHHGWQGTLAQLQSSEVISRVVVGWVEPSPFPAQNLLHEYLLNELKSNQRKRLLGLRGTDLVLEGEKALGQLGAEPLLLKTYPSWAFFHSFLHTRMCQSSGAVNWAHYALSITQWVANKWDPEQ